MFRVDLIAVVRANRSLAVLAEVRSENGGGPRPYALYVRLRPWATARLRHPGGPRAADLRRIRAPAYANDNLLIGYPLAYQYLTSLRADALPANADELIRMRGRGWLSSFSVGNPTPARACRSSPRSAGTPACRCTRLDVGRCDGRRDHRHARRIRWSATTTAASSSPAGWRSTRPGLRHRRLGGAGSVPVERGGAQRRGRTPAISPRRPSAPTSSTRAATICSRRNHAQHVDAADVRRAARRATARMVEGRYKIRPRFYAAARFDHLAFSTITGTTRTADVGRAGHAPRSRRRVLCCSAICS